MNTLPKVSTDEWSRTIGELISSWLTLIKMIPKTEFGHSVRVIATAAADRLAMKDFPPESYDQESKGAPDEEWAKHIAPLLARALVNDKVIKETDIDRVIGIATEEIFVWLAMEFRPVSS